MLGITLKETRVYREIKQEGREEGRKVEASSLILRQLTRRVGELSPELSDRIESLSLEELESLGEALLDFSTVTDLTNWLTERSR
jgi:predicted transposase YdaD